MSLEKNNILKDIVKKGYDWDEQDEQKRNDFYKKYGNIFQLENIDSLTPEVYREFWKDGIFHWGDGIPQSTGNLIKEFPWEAIQKSLKILVDESKSLSERIKNFQNTSTGGKYIKHSSYTVILHMINPQKYAIINKLSLFALDELKLSSKKERNDEDWLWVPKLENTILKLCTELNTDTWKIDWIWARLKEQQSTTWWIISAGKDPKREKVWDEFRNSNTVGFYWNETGDLSKLTEEQIKEKFKQIGIKERGEERDWGPARDILRVQKNDILFVKLGKRGFYGIGKATDTYQYNTNQSYHHTIPVQWITTQPYKTPAGYSPKLQLNSAMAKVRKKNQEPELVKYYENAINGKTLTSEEGLDAVTLDTFDRALKLKPNLILYGPPGTGKTWNANEIAKHIIKKYNSFPTWKLCAKRILFENAGKSLPYTTITEQILDKKLRFETSAETPQETVRSRLADDIKDNGTNSIFVKTDRGEYGFKLPLTFKAGIQLMLELNGPLSYKDMTKQLLEKNIIHTDGETPEKTLLAVITDEIKKNPDDSIFVQTSTPGTYDLRKKEVTTKSFVEKVTFHPSYSYEDFVEGFRPNQKEGETPYVLEKGIFQQICNTADKDPSNKYVLIIDEINRGNIPKILGELITLIEKDKRKPENSLKLTYSKDSFFVPENLIIIGTMNTADKSLMQMDDALKRRFVFEELMPDTQLLEDHLKKNNVPKAEDYSKILKRINEKITGDGKNKEALLQFRDRQIGHSYFWNIGKENNPDEDLQSIIKYDIIPLLQDYFYGDYSKMKEVLTNGDDEKESFDIIGKDNRTTELVNDISKSSDLKNYLLEI